MTLCALILCTMLGASAGGASDATEEAAAVDRGAGGANIERQFFGPLVAEGESAAGGVAGAGERYTVWRPLWLRQDATDEAGHARYTEHTFLYPLFSYRRSEQRLDWSLLNLINFSRTQQPAPANAQDAPPPPIARRARF